MGLISRVSSRTYRKKIITMSNTEETLESKIEHHIEHLRILGIQVAEANGSTEKSMKNIVQSIQDIDKCIKSSASGSKGGDSSSVDINTKIPLHVLAYIDQGKSPLLFTKDAVEKAINKNEQVNGQIKVISRFRERLINKLSAYYPEEMNDYVENCDKLYKCNSTSS